PPPELYTLPLPDALPIFDVGAVPPGHLRQRHRRAHLDGGHEPGFGLIRGGHDDPLKARASGGEHRRQHAGHGSEPTVETKLTHIDRKSTRLNSSHVKISY